MIPFTSNFFSQPFDRFAFTPRAPITTGTTTTCGKFQFFFTSLLARCNCLPSPVLSTQSFCSLTEILRRWQFISVLYSTILSDLLCSMTWSVSISKSHNFWLYHLHSLTAFWLYHLTWPSTQTAGKVLTVPTSMCPHFWFLLFLLQVYREAVPLSISCVFLTFPFFSSYFLAVHTCPSNSAKILSLLKSINSLSSHWSRYRKGFVLLLLHSL